MVALIRSVSEAAGQSVEGMGRPASRLFGVIERMAAVPDINDELESLRRENARLRKLLRLTEAEAAPAHGTQAAWFDKAPGSVDASSPPQPKVHFYAALFGARTDLYAIRWENARSGKSGWMPAVEVGWRKGNKPADQRYLPLTPTRWQRI